MRKINAPSRIDLLNQFNSAPDDALFNQVTIAAVRDCSTATLERDRWAGTGITFLKIGRSVKYRKSDVLAWLGTIDVKSRAAEYTAQAIQVFVDVMLDQKVPPATRLQAAGNLLEQSQGRPATNIEAQNMRNHHGE